MHQIVFKREFSVLFDAVKTENVQSLDEKIWPIKKDCYWKKSRKKSLKIWILKNPDWFLKKSLQGVLTPYLGYLHTKFDVNRTSRLGVRLYIDRWQTVCFSIIRDYFTLQCMLYSVAGSKDLHRTFIQLKNSLQ